MKMNKTPSPRKKGTNERRQKQPPGPGHPAPGDLHGQPLQKKTTATGHPASSPDIRPPTRNPASRPDIRTQRPKCSEDGPDSPDIRPLRKHRTSGTSSPNIRHLTSHRTSGPTPGHPAPPACAQLLWAVTHVSLRPFDYIYSLLPYVLGLALI